MMQVKLTNAPHLWEDFDKKNSKDTQHHYICNLANASHGYKQNEVSQELSMGTKEEQFNKRPLLCKLYKDFI